MLLNKNIPAIGIIFLFILGTLAPLTPGYNIRISKEEQPSILNRGNTLYVGGSGPGNYSTIQNAIDDAEDGDTIYVFNGTYYENILIDESIDLIGEDKTYTTIDGDGGRSVVIIIASSVKINGFTIVNSEQSGFAEAIRVFNEVSTINNIDISECIIHKCGKGIYGINVNFISITNCNIYNNLAQCISLEISENITINNCEINNNGEDLGDNWIRSGGITIDGVDQYSSNIRIFDCTIHDNIGLGIDIFLSENVKIYNDMIYENTWCGVYFAKVINIDVYNNDIYKNSMYGILLEVVYHITFYDNDVHHNGNGEEYQAGFYIANSLNCIINNNVISSNNADGICLGNTSLVIILQNTLSNNIDGISLKKSSFVNISQNTLSNNDIGINLDNSNDNNIFNNVISSSDYTGIRIHSNSNNNIISNNTIGSNNRYGTHLTNSTNNVISDNILDSNSYDGIRLDLSENNIISNNLVTNNNINGIRFFSSNTNIISDNNISQNELYGIKIDEYSYDNLIYHNNFINYNNAFDEGSNRWDSDYPSGGNYWFDYTGIDADYDGIGDSPYNIPGGTNQDRYPFISPDGWNTNPPQGPNLECVGYLRWNAVKPGSILTGRIYVKNIGESESELDWEISEYPEWGTWIFAPENGENLKPEDGIKIVEVTVVAPENKEQKFVGNVKIVNRQNIEDCCNLQVSLTTPRNKLLNIYTVLQRFYLFLQNFPNLFPILKLLLQRLGLQ